MYHPSKKPPNKILWGIVAGIVALHVVVLVIFGGITLYEAMRQAGQDFEDPPPAEKIERVKLEYKVRMDQMQDQSTRPKQKLQVQSVNNVNMPDVDIQVPNLGSTGNVGRFGDGRFGNIGDEGGLSVGEITVDLFDITSKGEKFLFVIDVRNDLMQDKKGGLPTYKVIKEAVNAEIQEMPAGVLFNVLLYERDRIEAWRPQLEPGTGANKEAFDSWFAPVNTGPDQTGIRTANLEAEEWNSGMAERLKTMSHNSANRSFLVAMAALEQVPDVIFWFSDTLPSFGDAVYRDEEDLRKAREEYLDRLKKAGYDSEEEYREARSKINEKIKAKVEQIKKAEQAARKKKGVPPRVYSVGENAALRRKVEEQLKDDPDYVAAIHPRRPDTEISERDMEQFFERILRMRYDLENQERPVLNAVIFRGADEEWTDEDEDDVDDFVDFFEGDHRVLKGLGAIDTEEFQD